MRFLFKSIFLLLLFPIIITFSQTDSLIISEVMFNPLASNSEFIEIFNLSYLSSINLSKFQIIYSTSNADTLVETDAGITLQPRSFAVILEGDYDLATGIYSTIIPDNALILKIDNNNFGSSGMANTSDRTVNLVNASGIIIDTYTYSANNAKGISDEKILLDENSSSTNWENSLIINGTPGDDNSVSPKENDLAVTELFYSPSEIYEENEVQLTAVIKNIGTFVSDSFSAYLFIDLNSDSIAQQDEIIVTENFSSLAPGDSTELLGQSNNLPFGDYSLYAVVDYSLDEDTTNNVAIRDITIFPKLNGYNDIVITEIMYAPTDGEPEWLEIYNQRDYAINLHNWRITDKVSSPIIVDTTFLIQPQEYIVISGDETIYNFYTLNSPVLVINLPSLNNTGDNLKLLDSLKREIDSVNYTPNWGGQNGYSLEKINTDDNGNDSTNWGSCISYYGGTPGKINSITPKEYDLTIDRFYIESKFVFIGDPVKPNIVVKNLGMNFSGNYSLQIFHDINADSIAQENELTYQFDQSGLSPNDSVNLFVELTDYNIGLNYYIAKLIYADDLDSDNNFAFLNFTVVETNENRNDIVINEIMYAPNSPEPEWIELYNRSDKIINLRNYQIADNNDTVKAINVNIQFEPFQYFVIAKDSSFISIYGDTLNFIISDFPNLNNTGDRIIILDSLNRIIDSLEYIPDWGGQNGISLERIDSELPSVDSTNWGSAILDSGGTPGIINSITPRKYDLAIDRFFPENNYAIIGETGKLNITVKNVGKNYSANYSLKIFHDVNVDSISQDNEFVYQFDEIALAPNDSADLYIELSDYNIGTNYYMAKLIYDDDMNSMNNTAYTNLIGVEINEVRNDIIINEIMYAPNSPEPEWIELYNGSDKIINIKNYQIADEVDTVKVIDNEIIFYPKQYFVIAKDSSFLDIYSDTLNFIISGFPILTTPVT